MILGRILCFLVAACEEIFKIASMAPGALLLEAHKEYEVEAYLCFITLNETCIVIELNCILFYCNDNGISDMILCV